MTCMIAHCEKYGFGSKLHCFCSHEMMTGRFACLDLFTTNGRTEPDNGSFFYEIIDNEDLSACEINRVRAFGYLW